MSDAAHTPGRDILELVKPEVIAALASAMLAADAADVGQPELSVCDGKARARLVNAGCDVQVSLHSHAHVSLHCYDAADLAVALLACAQAAQSISTGTAKAGAA